VKWTDLVPRRPPGVGSGRCCRWCSELGTDSKRDLAGGSRACQTLEDSRGKQCTMQWISLWITRWITLRIRRSRIPSVGLELALLPALPLGVRLQSMLLAGFT